MTMTCQKTYKTSCCFEFERVFFIHFLQRVHPFFQLFLRSFCRFEHFKGNGYFTSVYDFYVFVTMITQFMTPLAYLIISYSIMSIELWNSQTPGVDQDFSKRGSIKMMIAVVIVFTICWIPWHLFATIKAFWRDMAEL